MLGKGWRKKERRLMLKKMGELIDTYTEITDIWEKGFDSLGEELARVLEKEAKRKKNRNKTRKMKRNRQS